MFTKDQLIENGKHYFENKKITSMLATTDGNFFYEGNRPFAESHAKTNKIEVITITNVEVAAYVKAEEEKKKPAKKEEKVKDEKPKEEKTDSTPAKPDEKEIALMDQYKEETGKNAIYKGNITKGYLNWKSE